MSISGTFLLDPAIFDRWKDYESFRSDIHSCCAILEQRTGLSITIPASKEVPDALFAAHAAWQQEIALWLRDLLPGTTEELSHLKKSAILLAKLCEFGCIVVSGNGYRGDGPGRRSLSAGEELMPAPTRLKSKEIRKFKDGGCAYIGWLITYHVCEFFERHRDDKADPFESRITEEFEVDMVSGLLSAKVSAQSIHLVLKALFIRD